MSETCKCGHPKHEGHCLSNVTLGGWTHACMCPCYAPAPPVPAGAEPPDDKPLYRDSHSPLHADKREEEPSPPPSAPTPDSAAAELAEAAAATDAMRFQNEIDGCASSPTPSAREWPECREFFDRMQYYRHMPVERQADVIAAYEDVKAWLRTEREAYALAVSKEKDAEIAKALRLQVDGDRYWIPGEPGPVGPFTLEEASAKLMALQEEWVATDAARVRRETVEECAKVAEDTWVAELKEIGRGELRKYSGTRVRRDIAARLRSLLEKTEKKG